MHGTLLLLPLTIAVVAASGVSVLQPPSNRIAAALPRQGFELRSSACPRSTHGLATITPVYQQSLKLFGVQLGAATSFAISLAATANGLNRFAHFFTLGYGLSIASMAAAGLAAAKITTPAAFMHNVGLLLHGVRMSAFVAERDRSSSWKDRDAILAELDAKYGKKERLLPWAAYAAFYGLLYSPGLCHLRNPSLASSVFRPPFAYVITGLGLALQWGGLALEAVADHQKQAFKRVAPPRYQ
eukprot:CAMPEP_0172159170 /NCGR_PEP_ID=MMETSP1050-20130122/4811_1 /TAXON_ID=233186 /ORGANISM="Cryptomonas curvata, Strain CCAP979/52" /LENGTH=241 /DNA_ID=CAMNT_0012828707 /DNA_START=236 /DNA_END=961 /DNA_ORIENTATION=+